VEKFEIYGFSIVTAGVFRLIHFMPDGDSSLVTVLMVLLPLLLLLLFVVFLMVLRISARLRRMERIWEDTQAGPEEIAVQKRETQKQENSEYEEFLRQDGKRSLLSKREQSAAFREWRRERGKTWNASDRPDA
jgi:biopolymer transport protein ExbB/TolQ